jgi:membrane protease YdiL (CAAX protease family)
MTAPPTRPRSRAASIVGLIVALGSAFLLPYIPGQAHQNIADVKQDLGVVIFEWIVALVILAIVFFWERLPLGSIGFRMPSWRDVGAMGITTVALFVATAIFAALAPTTASGATSAQIVAVPLMLRIALFLTAGFCEELMFRAYAIERLTLFTGKLWVSGAVTAALFTLAHVPRYGFHSSLLAVAIIAAFLTALYLWRRNFWVCAAMHGFIDCYGLVIAPLFGAGAH